MEGGSVGASSAGKRKRNTSDEEDGTLSQAGAGSLSLLSFDDGNEDSEDDDDSEDGFDGDDDESIAGPCEYEESEEPLPNCAAYDKDFIQIGQDLVDIPTQVVRIIDDSSCDSRRAESCRNNAKGLTTLPRAAREQIALLGNTGAGTLSL